MNIRAWIVGLAVTTAIANAKESVSIRVSPATSFAPANLVIRTSVEPDFNNRAIEVTADSESFFRSSTAPLEGDRAPKTTTFRFSSLPPGDYEVTAAVLGVDGQRRAMARTHVNVIESGACE